MADFLKKLAGLFVYKEPSNKELGFELLENPGDTGYESEEPKEPQEQESKQGISKEKRQRHYKRPLNADQWIEKKKADSSETPAKPGSISKDLDSNIDKLKKLFNMPKNMDVVIREFNLGRKVKAFIVFMENMVDRNLLNSSLLPQLMDKDVFRQNVPECAVDYVVQNIIAADSVTKASEYHEAVTAVLRGDTVLFIDGCPECALIQTCGAEKRAITKPQTEPVVKGSHEALTESLDTNVSLIRKIIKNENLISEYLNVGNTNHSQVAVMYLKGVANRQIVNEVKKRINRIDTAYIAGTGFVEQFIEDNPYMLFPQVINTERPDRAANFIMEGLVVIIADGTPSAIAVPCTFFRLMHTSEDKNLRWPFATFLRLIRYIGLMSAIFLPGMYVALTLFHIEVIPTELLVSITRAKELVPFPTLVEILIMEISFEMVREGAIRVPGVIGQTLGIVGALILGQAAVTANLVSPILVIIVSLTAIGSFCIPNYELSLALRVARFVFIFAGACFGFYGISIMLSVVVILACSMKSFGVPFFAPVAPKTKINHDTILRSPITSKKERTDALNTPDRQDQGDNVKNWTKKAPENEGGT